MTEFTVRDGALSLAGEDSGEGPAVVLLHGLTATHRYVVMGSKSLERSGHRVIAYDARGHGHSSAAPTPDATLMRIWPMTWVECLTIGGLTELCWREPRWEPTRSCGSHSSIQSEWPA